MEITCHCGMLAKTMIAIWTLPVCYVVLFWIFLFPSWKIVTFDFLLCEWACTLVISILENRQPIPTKLPSARSLIQCHDELQQDENVQVSTTQSRKALQYTVCQTQHRVATTRLVALLFLTHTRSYKHAVSPPLPPLLFQKSSCNSDSGESHHI